MHSRVSRVQGRGLERGVRVCDKTLPFEDQLLPQQHRNCSLEARRQLVKQEDSLQ